MPIAKSKPEAAFIHLLRISKIARALTIVAIAILAVAKSAPVSAQVNTCPSGFNDAPALASHINQADIVAGKYSFKKIFAFGRQLFTTNFNKCDGAGRPARNGAAGSHGVGSLRTVDPVSAPRFTGISGPDSNSCSSCHSEPEVGGAASFRGNLFSPAEDCTPIAPLFITGSFFGTPGVKPCKPTVITTSTGFFNVFTERGSLGLFGSGAIELLSREMTDDLQNEKTNGLASALSLGHDVVVTLQTKGVQFGQLTARPNGTVDTSLVQGVSPDLVVRPMGRKGQNKSIRHFSLEAFNRHLGMQPDEALEQTLDVPDPDHDGVTGELTVGDMTAVMIFQAALPVPRQAKLKKSELQDATHGATVFAQVGCTNCHVPALKLNSTLYCEPNPRNNDGDFRDTSQSYCFDLQKTSGLDGNMVRAFTDLKRHAICDPSRDYDPITNHFCDDPPLASSSTPPATDKTGPGTSGVIDRPPYYQFLTAKLWDTGNSGPWGHRNDLDTIYEAIVAHGGEAQAVRDAFEALSNSDQGAVVTFLKSLRMPIIDNNPPPQLEGSPTAQNPGGNESFP